MIIVAMQVSLLWIVIVHECPCVGEVVWLRGGERERERERREREKDGTEEKEGRGKKKKGRRKMIK